jgi:hypothetical protein
MRFEDLKLRSLGMGWLGVGLLGLALGTSVMAKAQDEPKPPQQEEPKKPDEAKPARAQEEPKEAKPPKNEKQNEKQEEKQNSEMKPGKDQNRAVQNNGGDHAAPGGEQRGSRIPDDKFRAHFGRQHTFKVRTTVVEGQPRFQYSGYWFALANPWPVGWAYTDDCYVDYIDGEYVLIDLLHPGVMIALIVVE